MSSIRTLRNTSSAVQRAMLILVRGSKIGRFTSSYQSAHCITLRHIHPLALPHHTCTRKKTMLSTPNTSTLPSLMYLYKAATKPQRPHSHAQPAPSTLLQAHHRSLIQQTKAQGSNMNPLSQHALRQHNKSRHSLLPTQRGYLGLLP